MSSSAWADDLGYTEKEIFEAREQVAASPDDLAANRNLGKLLTRKYDATERSSVHDEAEGYLDKAVAIDGKDALALTYSGLLKCLYARDKKNKESAREGLALIDKAREIDPENLGIAFISGSICIEVPKDWNRREEGTDIA